MYRVVKVLNNNGILAIDMEAEREVILLGNGIGFGKKVNERFEGKADAKVYTLKQAGELKESLKIINSVSPVFLEIANRLIIDAENRFGKLDNGILLPLSDHIAFAVKRIKEGMEIRNPFTNDIRALFGDEFAVASHAREYLKAAVGLEINDDEVGYITLHIHSALDGENVEKTMTEAMLVRKCIIEVEQTLKLSIDINSLAYNRFSSHIRYMIARARKEETIALDMNEYVGERFPAVYQLAKRLCELLGQALKKKIPEVEIGYLALHIERVSQSCH